MFVRLAIVYEKSYSFGMARVSQTLTDILLRSGLSIAGLSRRAGVSRASVSEYVHGHRQPGVGQLERLAGAAGLQVDVTLSPEWAPRQSQLQDVLALADALPLRTQAGRTRCWHELTT